MEVDIYIANRTDPEPMPRADPDKKTVKKCIKTVCSVTILLCELHPCCHGLKLNQIANVTWTLTHESDRIGSRHDLNRIECVAGNDTNRIESVSLGGTVYRLESNRATRRKHESNRIGCSHESESNRIGHCKPMQTKLE